MPTVLAISPHLDDAIFSAGGTLARLSRQGWRVVVATVFTASVPDPQGFALACQLDKGLAPEVDYMALRREEDAAACAIIGAEPRWLPFVEAPHRQYGSAFELFDDLRDDDTIVDEITPAIKDMIQTLAPDEIFAPQAIGAHVDHVALYLALKACHRPASLWADFPYISRPSSKPSPFEQEIGLRSDPIQLTVEESRTKGFAAACYISQLGFQFGGVEAVHAAIRDAGCQELFAQTSCDDQARDVAMKG